MSLVGPRRKKDGMFLEGCQAPMAMTPKWRANVDLYKKNGSKVNPRARQAIIRAKSSWWTEASFHASGSQTPPEELARMRHNTQGTGIFREFD